MRMSMNVRTTAAWGCLSIAALAASLALPARGQQPEVPDITLEPLPRPATVLLADRPTVTVTLNGDYGPVRVTGSMAQAPKDTLRLTGVSGQVREVSWNEVRSLSVVAYPREGFPQGSFQIGLITDPVPVSQVQGAGLVANYGDVSQWRGQRLPEGTLTLQGQPYGSLALPLSRISAVQMEPIRGNVADLPDGTIKLQIFDGTTVNLPLKSVQSYQRNAARGTAIITLEDDQTFSGKIVDLPKVEIRFAGENPPPAIPLDRIAVLERTPPGGRRF